ncbi:MAG: T9SS type A sorting domain-containing protein [Chitinivibrionales bacterium]|nr:T9SS type A sorting domain-containing protein [Chitinivibrionales bacterium]
MPCAHTVPFSKRASDVPQLLTKRGRNVVISFDNSADITARMIALNGAVASVTSVTAQSRMTINQSNLKQGMYLLSIEANGKRVGTKMLTVR